MENRDPDILGDRLADRIAIAFCLAALLYILCGFISRAGPKPIVPVSLTPLDAGAPKLSGSAFAPGAVSNLARPGYIKGPLDLYGSFLERGDSTGSMTSPFFKAVPEFYIFVSGYPNRPGNRLLIEVVTADGKSVRLQVAPFEDTGSKWLLKRMSLRTIAGAQRFRILATDANKGPDGWLGFSLPFEDAQEHGRTGLLIPKQLALALLSAAAAFVALLAPGFMLRRKLSARGSTLFSLIWVAVPGLLGLALLGLFAWFGPRHIKAAVICRIILLLFFAFAARHFIRFRFSSVVTRTELRVLLVIVVLAAVSGAKSIYSLGPVGELYHDEISRILEIGGRTDSRLPYYVAQLVGLRQGPASPFARELYATWAFSDRGQLVALAAAPIVLAGPAYMPDNKPQEVWTVFDPQGFTAYRLSMIAFAACTLLSVFGLSRLFLSEPWSLFAVLVTATAPFFVHETYYTWPKMEAAAFVLLAGYLVLRSRFFLAGLALGLGYLCHPSALLSAPALCGLILLFPWFGGQSAAFSWRLLKPWLWRSVLLCTGLAVWLLFWRGVNGPNYTQGKFLSFALASGNASRTPAHWLEYRWVSFLNTLVPLNQFLFHAADENVNAIEGPSPPLVRFFVQPWSALPFAVGIAYFFCQFRFVFLGIAKARSWFVLLLVVPFLIFTAYMGIDSSGMLKEGLHAWVLTLLIFSVVIWKKYGGGSQIFWRVCNWALLSRAADLLLMMILPVIWTQHALVRPPFTLTDVLALATMIAGTIWLCLYTFKCGEALRLENTGEPIVQSLPSRSL